MVNVYRLNFTHFVYITGIFYAYTTPLLWIRGILALRDGDFPVRRALRIRGYFAHLYYGKAVSFRRREFSLAAHQRRGIVWEGAHIA